MRKILITDDWKKLKLKVGEKIELYGRAWTYDEKVDSFGKVIERSLDPA
jgi:hypothetical protein